MDAQLPTAMQALFTGLTAVRVATVFFLDLLLFVIFLDIRTSLIFIAPECTKSVFLSRSLWVCFPADSAIAGIAYRIVSGARGHYFFLGLAALCDFFGHNSSNLIVLALADAFYPRWYNKPDWSRDSRSCA